MRSLEAVFEEVLSFPVADQLRLVERIAHAIAEASAGAEARQQQKVSPVGWLAGEPEVADELGRLTAEVRARGRARGQGDENPG